MITWEEWEATYKPTSEMLYELTDIPKDTSPFNVWTVVDSGGRYVSLLNGYRIVDRLGYYTTEKSWSEDVFVTDEKEMYEEV
jgi:hypothetical protein